MTANELKRARAAMGLTQEQLAAELGVTSNTVARWERGVHPISPSFALLIGLLGKHRTRKEEVAR